MQLQIHATTSLATETRLKQSMTVMRELKDTISQHDAVLHERLISPERAEGTLWSDMASVANFADLVASSRVPKVRVKEAVQTLQVQVEKLERSEEKFQNLYANRHSAYAPKVIELARDIEQQAHETIRNWEARTAERQPRTRGH